MRLGVGRPIISLAFLVMNLSLERFLTDKFFKKAGGAVQYNGLDDAFILLYSSRRR